MQRALFIALASTLTFGACATESEVDDLGGDVALESSSATDGKADSASSTSTFYTVELDARRCVSPLCGGNWVTRTNASTTKCADGKNADRCYVAAIDFSALNLPAEQIEKLNNDADVGNGHLLLRGTIGSKSFGSFGKLGVFKATEAYVAGTDAPADGVFVRIKDMGVRCITTPCASQREDKLNSTLTATIANLDFAPSGATDDQIGRAVEASFHGGLIVVGDRYYVTGPGGRAKARHVNQFYTKVNAPCFVGGCASQLCSDHPGLVSTCIWKDEYACYADATCERQADDSCGWTQTDALQTCIADATN